MTGWIDPLAQDLRFAARTLRSNVRFTVVVGLTLAIGVAFLTTAFSAVDAVLLRPLPYPGSDRLVWIADFNEYFQQDTQGSRADYLIWRDTAQSFEEMTAYGVQDLALIADGEATQERVVSLTGDFWDITGVVPARGRLFADSDLDPIVLSHELAERRFANPDEALGQTVLLEGSPFTVVGILPERFTFLFPQLAVPAGGAQVGAYIPLPSGSERPGEPITQARGPAPAWVSVVGRLSPEFSIKEAAAELGVIHSRISREFPHALRGPRLTVTPLVEKLRHGSQRELLVLLAAASFVFLIAAANVSGLWLVQASKRSGEMAIRTALGAQRSRLARQVITEAGMVALLGGTLGLVLSFWLIEAVGRLGLYAAPRLDEASLDARVVLAAFAASLLTSMLVGAGAFVFQPGLRNASSKGDGRLRKLLVGAELALTLTLLVGAGLMLKSFWRMNERPDGFDPQRILSMQISLSGPSYDNWPSQAVYIRELLRTLEAEPGVLAVGIDTGTINTSVELEGTSNQTAESSTAAVRLVSADYLRAMGTPLLQGRWPQDHEALDTVLVNESFTRTIGSDRSLLGRGIAGSFVSGTIVGVVADFKHRQLDAPASPEVYYPYERSPMEVRSVQLLASVQDAETAAPAVREIVASIDRTQPIYRFATLAELLEDSIARRIFHLALLGSFAMSALVLALVGVYGLVAFSVEQRTREVGVRIAVGARGGQVVRQLVFESMGVMLAGILVGALAAAGLARLIGSLLYGVEPNDPVVFASGAVVLTLAALLACWVPARKAATIDPIRALRHE